MLYTWFLEIDAFFGGLVDSTVCDPIVQDSTCNFDLKIQKGTNGPDQFIPVGRVPARGKRYTLRIFLLPFGLRVVIQEFKMPVQFYND